MGAVILKQKQGANAAPVDLKAASATKLETARKLEITGDLAGSVTFDGSKDIVLKASLKNIDELLSPPGARSAVIPANTAFTVPQYIVGSGRLQVFLDGLLCMEGANATQCVYVETGTTGTTSNNIKFHQAVNTDMEIHVRVL